MKYDKMVEITKTNSQKKILLAQKAISEMVEHAEKITVAELVRRTGLSRGFFYKNNTIRSQLDSALYNQQSKEWKQTVVPEDKESKQTIISLKREVLKEKEMSKELAIRNREISEENQILREKIEKMEKQIKQKTVSILKKL